MLSCLKFSGSDISQLSGVHKIKNEKEVRWQKNKIVGILRNVVEK